jgi:hypothetical protein
METCPSPEQWSRLLADELGGPEAEAIEAHVEGCAACQQALERLLGPAAATPSAPGSGHDFLLRLAAAPPTHRPR